MITYNSNNKRTSSAFELVQWSIDLSRETSIDQQCIEDKVFAIQTTRIAPSPLVSDINSPYQGFNLGLHVGDCTEQVNENRDYLKILLPEHVEIQWLEQVHGNKVIEVSHVSESPIVADAAVTKNKNTCLAIMTADCLPILLVSKSGDEVAAIHGGWRPLSDNIIHNTIAKMQSPAENIYAWLGPCISKDFFEVGSEVKTKFMQHSDVFKAAFIEKSQGKYLADLYKIAEIQLNALGVTQINALSECTYSNTDKYYSYRKDNITGRMVTLICLL